MEYSEFIQLVQQGAGGPATETAERATEATLRTLAERLSPGEARRIALELPAGLMPWLHTESAALALSIDEFLDRVADREGTDVETALRHARGVFFALGGALSAESVAHLADQLPPAYAPLGARRSTLCPSFRRGRPAPGSQDQAGGAEGIPDMDRTSLRHFGKRDFTATMS